MAIQGKKTREIIGKLAVQTLKVHDVSNWIKQAKKGKGFKANAVADFPKFNDWLREHLVAENGLCWETIESIKEKEIADVRDITTLEGYHNFFANGFLTGNCGLVKNLALLSEVTTESDEMTIEKLIRDMGVRFK